MLTNSSLTPGRQNVDLCCQYGKMARGLDLSPIHEVCIILHHTACSPSHSLCAHAISCFPVTGEEGKGRGRREGEREEGEGRGRGRREGREMKGRGRREGDRGGGGRGKGKEREGEGGGGRGEK